MNQNDLVNLIKESWPIMASIFGSYISLKVSLTKVETKVDRLEKDLDNIGGILGTEKSKGRKQK